jgi:hypothetical protein
MQPYYKSGSWNFICEVCGQRYKAEQMRKRWDGVIVCPKDWEPRHPQDFVRGVKDDQSVPITRDEAPNTFLPLCTPITSCSIVDVGIVDCARVNVPYPDGFGVA